MALARKRRLGDNEDYSEDDNEGSTYTTAPELDDLELTDPVPP
jgi:hypothetical protein